MLTVEGDSHCICSADQWVAVKLSVGQGPFPSFVHATTSLEYSRSFKGCI